MIEERDLLQNTIVIFASDNGGLAPSATGSLRTEHSTNGPLTGSKGSVYEGGHRIPIFFRWDGVFPAGESVPYQKST